MIAWQGAVTGPAYSQVARGRSLQVRAGGWLVTLRARRSNTSVNICRGARGKLGRSIMHQCSGNRNRSDQACFLESHVHVFATSACTRARHHGQPVAHDSRVDAALHYRLRLRATLMLVWWPRCCAPRRVVSLTTCSTWDEASTLTNASSSVIGVCEASCAGTGATSGISKCWCWFVGAGGASRASGIEASIDVCTAHTDEHMQVRHDLEVLWKIHTIYTLYLSLLPILACLYLHRNSPTQPAVSLA